MKPTKKKILEFLRESNAIEGVFGEEPLNDAMEAWEYAYEHRDSLTLNDVLEIHFLLLQNLDPEIAGRWRDCDVWIGGHLKKFFHESVFKEGVQSTLDWINNPHNKLLPEDLEGLAQDVHVDFEKLHPFNDGNGRTGRILWQIHRLHLGLPMKVIYDKEKQSYYKWFR